MPFDLNQALCLRPWLAGSVSKVLGRVAMKVHFYGRLAEALGPTIEIELSGNSSIADLRERLAKQYPYAAGAFGERVRACLGEKFVPDEQIIGPDDSVEFIPPVSGG